MFRSSSGEVMGRYVKRNGSLLKLLTPLGAVLVLLFAKTGVAACVDGAVTSCVTTDKCPGQMTCEGRVWGECYASVACNEPPPMKLKYESSGIGAGREVLARSTDFSAAPITTYLFKQAQTQVTFTATAEDPARGVSSIKFEGTLKRICMKRRSDASLPEERYIESFPVQAQKVASAWSASLSTSVGVSFTSYTNEWRCPAQFTPWRQDLQLAATATDGWGGTLRTNWNHFIFVQSFKVATYNILHGHDNSGADTIEKLARHLSENEVDVVVLQEASSAVVDRLSTSPYIGALRGYIVRSGNDDLAILSKFPIVGHQVIPHSLGIEGYNPVWHYAVLDLGGFQAKVANLHLIADSVAENREINAVAHRRQEVEDVLQHMRSPGMPSIIGGDLNATVFSDAGFTTYRFEFEPLAQAWPYRNMCVATSCLATPVPVLRYYLDQLWVWETGNGFSFVDAYTAFVRSGQTEPSDHWMQVTRLHINE